MSYKDDASRFLQEEGGYGGEYKKVKRSWMAKLVRSFVVVGAGKAANYLLKKYGERTLNQVFPGWTGRWKTHAVNVVDWGSAVAYAAYLPDSVKDSLDGLVDWFIGYTPDEEDAAGAIANTTT